MSSAPTADEIACDAKWLAQAVDPNAGMVRLIAMDRDSYRAASFLDDRMMQAPVDAQIVDWTLVEEAASADDLRTDARWIFHIGHVGSTLLSRLLGEIPGVLALREPRLPRDMALVPPRVREQYIGSVPKLMSRSFAEDEFACVKATSFVSEIAPQLVPPGERALFMYASPRNYVASILAGENSVKELRMLVQTRAARMAGRVAGLDAQAQSDAHLAAAAWACETTSLESAAEQMADRKIAWVDFDRMLENVPDALGSAARHFGFRAEPAQLQAIASGPLMRRYSKALEYDYSPALRRELIAEAEQHHRRDIESALAMLRSAAEKSPLLARALSRAENRT
jgi:Skp family chaperone for outer membrane proteins